jgi:hypothetical protein
VLVVSATLFGLACIICICYLSIRTPGAPGLTQTGERDDRSLMTVQESLFSAGWS